MYCISKLKSLFFSAMKGTRAVQCAERVSGGVVGRGLGEVCPSQQNMAPPMMMGMMEMVRLKRI